MPLTTSLIVPSPPATMTRREPSAIAERAIGPATRGPVVGICRIGPNMWSQQLHGFIDHARVAEQFAGDGVIDQTRLKNRCGRN